MGLGIWPRDGVDAQRRQGALERLLWHGAAVGVPWIDIAHDVDAVLARTLGRWMGALPQAERPAVMVKAGVVRADGEPDCETACVLRSSVLEAQLDAALALLGLDAADVFLLHHPDETGTPIEESWSAAASLVAAGKTTRVGLCGFDLGAMRHLEALRHVDVCLVRIDPFALEACLPLLWWCAACETDVIAWVAGDVSMAFDPAYAGPLVGTSYDRGDRKLERVLSLSVPAEVAAIDAIRRTAREDGVSPEAVVRGWLLSQPGVTGVVVGAESGAQLDGWFADRDYELTMEAERRITRTGAQASSRLSLLGLSVAR